MPITEKENDFSCGEYDENSMMVVGGENVILGFESGHRRIENDDNYQDEEEDGYIVHRSLKKSQPRKSGQRPIFPCELEEIQSNECGGEGQSSSNSSLGFISKSTR